MKEPANMALVRVSPEMMADLLELSKDIAIVGSRWDFDTRSIIFYLNGPGLPEHHIGEVVVEINPATIKRV